jgi:hypothetical protein
MSFIVVSRTQEELTRSQDAFLRNNRALNSRLTVAALNQGGDAKHYRSSEWASDSHSYTCAMAKRKF